MANPNISSSGSIYGRTIGGGLTTASAVVVPAVTTSHIYKVNSIIVSNVSGSSAADVTVTWYDASVGVTYYLAYIITVPAKSTLVVLSKDSQIYLEESDYISALASANSTLQIIVSFEDIYA